MKSNNITLKQIAAMAGVSTTAVSKVLNHKPIRISDDKRQNILRLAESLDYTPNLVARSLVLRQSGILGLIVPDIENPFFSRLAKQLEQLCRRSQYSLMIMNSDDIASADRELLDILVSRQVEGVFLVPSNESMHDQKTRDKLRHIKIPYVLVDRVIPDLPCNQVSFDNQNGAYQAVKHLIDFGHKKIALIGPPDGRINGNARYLGYVDALTEAGIELNPDYVFDGNYRFDSGYQAAKGILESDVTAVMSCNDMMTLGFIKRMLEEGKEIPGDYSLVSYDHILDLFSPTRPITAVSQDVNLLAKESFRLMKNLLLQNKVEQVQLKLELVVYRSVRPIQSS